MALIADIVHPGTKEPFSRDPRGVARKARDHMRKTGAATDSFWAPRLRINQEVTIPSQHRYLEETGRIENFRRAAGKLDQPFVGIYFNDSDVYKWLEAAAWVLASDPDAAVGDRPLAAKSAGHPVYFYQIPHQRHHPAAVHRL